MRIPGPADVLRIAGDGYDALERVIGLVPRVVVLVSEAESLLVTARQMITGVGDTAKQADTLVDRATRMADTAEPLVTRASDIADSADVLVGRADVLVGRADVIAGSADVLLSRAADVADTADVLLVRASRSRTAPTGCSTAPP